MVRIFPVKSLVAVDPASLEESQQDDDPLSTTAFAAPNRFRSEAYDRSVFGSDDCKLITKAPGTCHCNMCCPNPMVILSTGGGEGEPICDQYNITLRNVQEFVDGGLLKFLHDESFIIYCQFSGYGKAQIGVFAAVDVDDCLNNAIRKHEQVTTTADRSMETPAAAHPFKSSYVDPVMVMYRENDTINALVQRILDNQDPVELVDSSEATFCQPVSPQIKNKKAPPFPFVTTPGGRSCSGDSGNSSSSGSNNSSCGSNSSGINFRSVGGICDAAEVTSQPRHFMWLVKDKQEIAAFQQAFSAIDAFYIADGHHRTAAACKARLENGKGPRSPAHANSARYLTALIYSDSQLNVLSYNRCVKSIPAGIATANALLQRISCSFRVEEMCFRGLRSKYEAEVQQQVRSRGVSSVPSPLSLQRKYSIETDFYNGINCPCCPSTELNGIAFDCSCDGVESYDRSAMMSGAINSPSAAGSQHCALNLDAVASALAGITAATTATSAAATSAVADTTTDVVVVPAIASPLCSSTADDSAVDDSDVAVTAVTAAATTIVTSATTADAVSELTAVVAGSGCCDEPGNSSFQYDICMYLENRWYRLEPRAHIVTRDESLNPLSCVDSQVLLDHLLNPIFHMHEMTADNSMIYVDGRYGMAGIEALVDGGEAAVGFAVGSVSTSRIMQVADAAQLLPAKATFFDPKPTPGLFLRLQH